MGYFFDFLTGGNIKIAASSIAKLHYNMAEDYVLTYITRIRSLLIESTRKNNSKTRDHINLVLLHKIRNYTDLAILDLNINAAPVSVGFYETYNSFSKEVSMYLFNKGIYEKYVIGDNTLETEEFVSELRETFNNNFYWVK